jgi:hypothetical protein
MTQKYLIHNQLTGLQEEALTFEQAKILQEQIKQAYYDTIQGLFTITVLTENEDNSWTQCIADAEGNPIVPDIVEPSITE